MIHQFIAKILPFIPKDIIWQFSKTYIAGKNLDKALIEAKKLNAKKLLVTVDLLGEFVKNLAQVENYHNQYLSIITNIEKQSINGNYSLKPSMFGLLLDKDRCFYNIKDIVSKAASYHNFVRLDMEDSKCVDLEIELFEKLHKKYPANVGIVFQSYLKRTMQDLQNISKLNTIETPINIRLCKGIYIESEKIAYKNHSEINKHFVEDLKFLFQQNIYTGIATHDKYLIREANKLIKNLNIPKNMYEFQMLYGVRPKLRNELVSQGHVVRVYLPFGKEWFGYSTRRLQENPHIVRHIIKALFYKG